MLAIVSHYFDVFLRILAKLYNSVLEAMARTSWQDAVNRLWEGYHPHWSPRLALYGMLIVLAVLVIFLVLNLLGKTYFRQGLSAVILTIYLTFVFGSTVFTRDPGQFMAPNFNLFLSYRAMLASQSYLAAKGIVLNMLLLMPIGLLLPIILQKRFFLWPVLFGFGCSLAIEIMQYVFHCGMFDLDDLLNNTLGVWIGYMIYWVVTLIPYFRTSRNRSRLAASRKIG
jgi:glycopeptide antibiotics resistance protein